MEAVSLLGILGWGSIRDVRCRSLRAGMIYTGACLGIWLHLYFGRLTIWNLLGGMAVGGMLYLYAVLSKERIGKGDALMVMVCGIFLGFWQTLLLLWIALFAATVFGMIITKSRHISRQRELPFIPFLLVGYVLCLYMWGGLHG